MQKNIGSKLALYPMPLLVIGTMVEGKANWVLVGHSGIIGHDRVMVSLAKPHYTKFSPVLFEFPNYTYLRTGDTIGNCLRLDNKS